MIKLNLSFSQVSTREKLIHYHQLKKIDNDNNISIIKLARINKDSLLKEDAKMIKDTIGFRFGMPNGYNPCYIDLVLKDIDFPPANAYQADNEITIRAANSITASNITFQSGAKVNFVAGNKIELLPGFNTGGGEFRASIEPSDCYSVPHLKRKILLILKMIL